MNITTRAAPKLALRYSSLYRMAYCSQQNNRDRWSELRQADSQPSMTAQVWDDETSRLVIQYAY